MVNLYRDVPGRQHADSLFGPKMGLAYTLHCEKFDRRSPVSHFIFIGAEMWQYSHRPETVKIWNFAHLSMTGESFTRLLGNSQD